MNVNKFIIYLLFSMMSATAVESLAQAQNPMAQRHQQQAQQRADDGFP